MTKYKIKGYAVEELTEIEIEAASEEEAKSIYEEKYFNSELVGEGTYIEYDEDSSDDCKQ
jgi:hypothetical protein